MNNLTVDIIDDFIQGLDLSGKILSFSDNGINTTLIVAKTFHARTGMTLNVDGTDYEITSVVHNSSITVSGIIASPVSYSVQLPYYFHGTPIGTNNQIKEMNHMDKIPMIYLYEIIRERDQPIASGIERESDLIMFFLDSANFSDWETDDHYSQRLAGLNSLVDEFKSQAINDRGRFFLDNTIFTRINHIEWGIFADNKGHINNIFDDELTGIELSFTLPIKKFCC